MVKTQEELLAVLQTLSLPVAYDHFEVPQELPYIAYLTTRHAPFAADNLNYRDAVSYGIELYTEYKDPELEEAMKEALANAGLFFAITADEYLTTEQMYLVTFEVTI